MHNIIKTFEFNSENVKLILNIKNEVYKNSFKMIIEGDLISDNKDLVRVDSTNFSSYDVSLKYLGNQIIWISSNEWKGLRWGDYYNSTLFLTFRNVNEMKQCYLIQKDFIEKISCYFYDCIKNYMKMKLLYETQIDEVILDK